jgi:hypothetical protein
MWNWWMIGVAKKSRQVDRRSDCGLEKPLGPAAVNGWVGMLITVRECA